MRIALKLCDYWGEPWSRLIMKGNKNLMNQLSLYTPAVFKVLY